MRSNIRTLQDYTPTTSTEITLAPGDNPISAAFAQSAERNIEQRNWRIPTSPNGEDNQWLSEINGDPETLDFRVGILANIAERRCDPGTYNFVLSHMNEVEISRLSTILNTSISYSDYESILSTILLGTGIDTEIGHAIQQIIREIRLLSLPETENFTHQISDMRNEMHETIQSNVERSNSSLERIGTNGNNERNRIFSTFSWYALGSRTFSILGVSAGAYFGAPYLSPIMGLLGQRVLPLIGPLTETGLTRFWAPTSWNDVHSAFMHSWSLFFDYWRR